MARVAGTVATGERLDFHEGISRGQRVQDPGRLLQTSVSWRRCRIDDKDLLPLHVLSFP
jgi:hypothetical protein